MFNKIFFCILVAVNNLAGAYFLSLSLKLTPAQQEDEHGIFVQSEMMVMVIYLAVVTLLFSLLTLVFSYWFSNAMRLDKNPLKKIFLLQVVFFIAFTGLLLILKYLHFKMLQS